MSYLSGSSTGIVSGFTNPMPLDTFLQGTRSDAQVVNLIGVTDNFGRNDIIVGDVATDTPVIIGSSDGFTTKTTYTEYGDRVIWDSIQDMTANTEMYDVMDLGLPARRYSYSSAAANPTGVLYSYRADSGLPANNDVLHTFDYEGVNDAAVDTVYAGVQINAIDITENAEIGQYVIKARDLGGLYSPFAITGAKRIDINLTAGATQYTALYDQASLSETFTDNSNNLTVLTQDTNQWELVAQDIGLSSFGTARIRYDGITLSLTDGFIAPVLKLDYNTPYFGLGDPGDFGMMIDINNNWIQFDGTVVFNDELTTGVSSLLGFFGASATGQLGPIADPTGGSVVDVEARAAMADLLAAMRTYGLLIT